MMHGPLRTAFAAGGSLSLMAVLLTGSAQAHGSGDVSMETFEYRCARSASVLATYLNTAEDTFAVIFVEGQQVAMRNLVSGSGAKYAQSLDGAGYVWWTKGDEAFLHWNDPAAATDEVLLNECKAR